MSDSDFEIENDIVGITFNIENYIYLCSENNQLEFEKQIIKKNDIEIIKRFDMINFNQNSLRIACKYNSLNIVKYFICVKEIKITTESIETACKYGNLDIVITLFSLVSYNKSFLGRSCELAFKYNQTHVVKYFNSYGIIYPELKQSDFLPKQYENKTILIDTNDMNTIFQTHHNKEKKITYYTNLSLFDRIKKYLCEDIVFYKKLHNE